MRTLLVLILAATVLLPARPGKWHKPPRRHPVPKARNTPSEFTNSLYHSKTISFSKGGLDCRIVQSVHAKANKDGSITVTVKCLF